MQDRREQIPKTILAYGLNGGATVVRWALTAATIDLAADSAGLPVSVRAFIAAVVFVFTLSVFFPNHLGATRRMMSSASRPRVEGFSQLSFLEKAFWFLVTLGGTVTLTNSMVEITKALALFWNNYILGLGPTFVWGRDTATFFQMTLLTSLFFSSVLMRGYPEFLEGVSDLSRIHSRQEFNRALRHFSAPGKVLLAFATLAYIAGSFFQNQTSSEGLTQNFGASIFIGLLTAINNAITYVGQVNHNAHVVTSAWTNPVNPGRFPRLGFFANTLALTGNVAVNTAANVLSVNSTAGHVLAPAASFWADGIFNASEHMYGEPRVEVLPDEAAEYEPLVRATK